MLFVNASFKDVEPPTQSIDVYHPGNETQLSARIPDTEKQQNTKTIRKYRQREEPLPNTSSES